MKSSEGTTIRLIDCAVITCLVNGQRYEFRIPDGQPRLHFLITPADVSMVKVEDGKTVVIGSLPRTDQSQSLESGSSTREPRLAS